MPVYVYKNIETGETFEYQQRISEPALTEHPETGQPVRRVIQPVGIAFKGSGFYVNDSRSSSKSSPAPKSDAAAADSAAPTATPAASESPKAGESAKATESSSASSAKPASTPASN